MVSFVFILLPVLTGLQPVIGAPSFSDGLLPGDLPEATPGPGGDLNVDIPVPMPAPTGGGGIELSLSLSGGQSGLLGNWDLDGLSFIQRERRDGILYNSTDSFSISAGGRLVHNGDHYRSEIDNGTIYRAEGSCGNGPCIWTAYLPDGGRMIFGETTNSRVRGPADIVEASSTVLTWHLSRVVDNNGNYATVEYDRDQGQIFPIGIEYTKNDETSLAGRRVEFVYEEKPVQKIVYSAGIRKDLRRVLRAIRSFYKGEEIFAQEFSYEADALSGAYRLVSVGERIRGQQLRSPITLQYRQASPTPSYRQRSGNTGVGTPDAGKCKSAADWCYASSFSDFLDPTAKAIVDGMCTAYQLDGWIDRCATGNTWQAADLSGDGRMEFTAATDDRSGNGLTVLPLHDATGDFTASPHKGEKGTTFFADMNGDGRDDLVGLQIHNGFPTTYSLTVSMRTNTGFAAPVYFRPPNGMGMGYDPDLHLKQILLFLISMKLSSEAAKKQRGSDFYGRTKGIIGPSGAHMLFGTGRFNRSAVNSLLLGQVVLSGQGSPDNYSQIADMNGDGLVDFVRLISPTVISVAFNTGSGFGGDVTSSIDAGIGTGGEFTPSTGVNLEAVGDRNGDGNVDDLDVQDLMDDPTLTDEQKAAYINVGGSYTRLDGFRSMGDVNGDGIPDFITLIKDGSQHRLKAYLGRSDGRFVSYILSDLLDPGASGSRYMLDANGDGYTDFVRLTGPGYEYLTVTYGTGTGFGESVSHHVGTSVEMGRTFADMDGDGTPDFVRFVSDNGGYLARVRFFRGDGYGGSDVSLDFRHSNSSSLNSRFVFYGDTNGDGRAELIAPRGGAVDIYGPPADSPELLASISNGYQKLSIAYQTAAESGVIDTNLAHRESGATIQANSAPRFLVSEIEVSGKTGKKARTTFSYQGDLIRLGPTRQDSKGLGPEKRITRSYVWNGAWVQAPTYTEEEFVHRHPTYGYDAAGLPSRNLVRRTSDDSVLQEESYAFTDTATVAGTKRFSPSNQTSVNRTMTLEGGGALEIRKTHTVLAFDSLGNPTCSVESVSYNGQVSGGETRATKTTFSYSSDGTRPFALPVEETVRAGSNCDAGTMLSYRTFGYDSVGNATVVSEGPSAATLVTTLRTYDAVGNVLTETRFGRTTTQVYDSDTRTQVIRTISPMGLESVRDYDLALGLLLKETDSDGRIIEYTYDELGRKLTATLKPPGLLSGSHILETNEYSFDPTDGSSTTTTTKATAGTGTVSQITQVDEWGRTIAARRSSAGGWITTDRQYDIFDRPVRESLPYFDGQSAPGYSETTYDSLGRPIRITRPGPNGTNTQELEPGVVAMTSFTSDDGVTLVGLAQKEDRQNGQVVYQYKTADGRALVTLHSTAYSTPNQPDTQVSGWNRTRYHYDGRGQLRQITRGIGTSRTPAEDSDLTSYVVYDEWGRRSQVYDPDKGISRYTYTEDGQPLCDTDPDGLTICRSYDTYGRLLSVTRQSDGKVLSQYFYDESQSTLGTGRLTSVKDESGTRRMHYDALTGKPARIERTYNALGNEKQFDIENTYDETGALVKRTFPSINVSLRYDYHAGGPLAAMQIEDPDRRILSSGSVFDVVRTSIPDALGNIGTITYGNGVVIQSRYSTTGVLQQITTQGNALLSDYTYRWNDEGMLVEKQDLLAADGINRSEQFSYDTSRRLVEATGPYGDRNTPHRTLQYAYGVDGQPIVADEKVYNYDVSNPHRLKSFNQRSYAYDNDTTPDKNKGLVVEKRAPGNVVSRFQYHWTGRIKQAQTINGATITTVDYEYDTEGSRFIKRTDLGGIVTEIHDLSSDYRVHADGTSEVHTIEVRNGNEPVARFRFQDNHHNSGVWAPSSLFGHRLGADLLRIALLEDGITKLPSLMAYAAHDAYYAAKLLPQIQNRARLLVMLYWTLAAIVALAALTLLVRNWRRNPDDGPGLLPVGVYRFGSILALLSFSATGCIQRPSTEDGSQYLLLANGSTGSSSEGGSGSNSSTMSVLGAFYFISTHNGSTDIVTNSDGVAVARFLYEPFGKVNSDLTDLDPDRNGIHYGETFLFTGQEFEPETGLYNYKARIHDPETGRFLQPDPVHTDQPGQDNWDRYQYVWNNPVNFVDPDGEAGCFPNTMYGHNFSGPSACGILPDASERFLINYLLLIEAFVPEAQKKEFRTILIAYWLMTKRPKKPITKVDRVSMRHDIEQKHVFDTTHKKKSIDADWRWIRDGWGAMFSSNYFPDTYQREYDATPEWWGDARGLVAGINTIGTFMADLFVLSVGTRLFGLHIMVNAIATAGDALARTVTPSRDIVMRKSIEIRTPIGNIRSTLNMKLLDKDRFKNLNRI
ncbi:RHS repeat-associated core domain-containing protein [Leptonema illini]|uniref:RHS repeat-associated core domain-containing protein n=1 Tax=Leptonema illini TaxID=183 RepID=UPI0003038226|nr:RHS repeat-associated core domain-containing protein [Leptonema illini]